MPKKKKKVIYINYYDSIDQLRIKHLMAIITNVIAQEKPDTLYFIFSSNGGSVDAGVTFYNFLKSLPLEIVTHNVGSIDSIANVIFVAGDRRYSVPHATFLFHGVAVTLNGNHRLTLPQINEIRDRIHKDHNKIAGIICDNTSIIEKDLKRLFTQGETKNVSFALEKNIIHKVKPLKIPKDALLISININS